jgi:hypothetical protein
LERAQLLEKLFMALQTHENEDSEFFVRMFEHEFGDDPPWRRPQRPNDVVFVLQSDQLGPVEDLGPALMRDFLLALSERPRHPRYLVLLSRAVYLAVREGECLPCLQKLGAKGTRILVSKSSLEYFDKSEDLRVGEAVSMLQVVDTLYEVEKVIRL